MTIIETKNLVKKYYSGEIVTYALKDVTLNLSDGEILAIMVNSAVNSANVYP